MLSRAAAVIFALPAVLAEVPTVRIGPGKGVEMQMMATCSASATGAVLLVIRLMRCILYAEDMRCRTLEETIVVEGVV